MYSLVIPAYNEAKNLPKLLKKAAAVLKRLGKFEIIVVNDNSTDNSLHVLKNLKKEIKQLQIINRTTKPGVGYTIREGLHNAKGDIIITIDGDLSHDPKEIPNFLKLLNSYDMVCGSRYVNGGKANMTKSRILISRLFNIIFRTLIGVPVRDFTSGFKVYKAEIIKQIKLVSKKFGIYIEIPIKAHLAGFKLTEIPITYNKREFEKTNLNYFVQGPEYLKVALSALKYKILKK